MLSLAIRNLVFTILQPGIVAGVIPIWITGFKPKDLWIHSWMWNHFLGVLLFLIGFSVMTWCITDFAIKGKGTLSPIDPTKKLVISGLYKYSRNPMYVGVLLLLFGEALFLGSNRLWIYLILVFILFNIFIYFVEEPRLKRDFNKEYELYCKRVRRWI